MNELPAVAKRFTNPCKKCDSERYHIVLAHVNTKSAKIECEVCKKKSTYKLKSLSDVNKLTAAKTKKTSKSASNLQNWPEVKEKINEADAKAYSIKISLEQNDSIKHTKFGLGYVLKTEGKRAEVVFEEGIKVLIHNQ